MYQLSFLMKLIHNTYHTKHRSSLNLDGMSLLPFWSYVHLYMEELQVMHYVCSTRTHSLCISIINNFVHGILLNLKKAFFMVIRQFQKQYFDFFVVVIFLLFTDSVFWVNLKIKLNFDFISDRFNDKRIPTKVF